MKETKEPEIDSNNFGRKMIRLQLHNTGYEENDSHTVKLLTVMKSLLKNGPTSKWDLATVKYRDTVKNGLTTYNWVLIHKLISELLRVGLVKKHGKGKETQVGKKHDVFLYYPTVKGIVFAMCSDKRVWVSNLEGPNNFQFCKLDSLEKDLIITLTKSFWSMYRLDSTTGNEIRLFTMNKILISRSSRIEDILIESIVDYVFITFQNFFSIYVANKQSLFQNEFLKFAIIRSALSNIKNKKILNLLSSGLALKVEQSRFSIKLLEWIYEEFGELPDDIQRGVTNMRIGLDQLFLRGTAISDLGGTLDPTFNDSSQDVTKQTPSNSSNTTESLLADIDDIDLDNL